MWKKTLRVSEWLINALSLVLLIYITTLVARPHFGAQEHVRVAPLKTGQVVKINGVNWAQSRHTLVLALQTTCHYCAASAPFYKQLMRGRDPVVWQAVAVLPQPVDRATAYMRTEGYSIPQVRQMNLNLIGIAGTPTLLLVNQKGRLEKRWVGQLSPTGENEVAEALGMGKVAQDQPAVLVAGMGGGLSAGSSTGGLTSAVPAQVVQQPGSKTVRLQHRRPDDPVRIVQVFDGSQDVTPRGLDKATGQVFRSATGKPFQAGDDWLKNLSFVVKNLSGKEITAADFELSFPQTGNGTPDSPIYIYTIMLGREPENALYNWRTGRKRTRPATTPLTLLPGGQARISLAPYYDSEIEAPIDAKQPMSTVTTCVIAPSMIYFTDGTRWNGSFFEKADPSLPGRYVPISLAEFRRTTSAP